MSHMTFNGTASSTLHLTRCVPQIPLLPRKRETSVEIIGREGKVDFGRDKYANRIIPVDCLVEAANLATLRTYIAAISEWLSGEGWLIFDHDPTVQWYGKIYDEIVPEYYPTAAKFTVNFDCKPWAQSVTKTEGAAVDTETDYGSDVEFYPDINITLCDLENDMTAGNMDDAADWTSVACADGVASNVLSATGDGSAATFSETGDCDSAVDITHVYYVYCKAQVTDAVCQSIALKWDGSTAGALTSLDSQATPAIDTWYALSAVETPEADFEGNIRVQFDATYADAGTANGKVLKIKECMVIDLTAVFGAGNEPDLATMDGYVSDYMTAQSVTWWTDTLATYAQATLASTSEYVRTDDTYSNQDALIFSTSTGKATLNGTACMDTVSISSLFFDVPTGNQTINITSDGFYVATVDYYKRYYYA